MARCEDFPCCGHDICPDFDDSGRQINMKCVCGATVPLHNRSSLCDSCLNTPGPEDDFEDYWGRDEEDCDEKESCGLEDQHL